MRNKPSTVALAVTASLLLLLAPPMTATATDPASVDFAPGQVWHYHTRPNEPDSTLIVCKVDADPEDRAIVHVQLQGLELKNPLVDSGYSTHMDHAPITPAALSKSVTELVGTGSTCQDFQAGYETWSAGFRSGKAGVFTVTVSEIVSLVEQALNR